MADILVAGIMLCKDTIQGNNIDSSIQQPDNPRKSGKENRASKQEEAWGGEREKKKKKKSDVDLAEKKSTVPRPPKTSGFRSFLPSPPPLPPLHQQQQCSFLLLLISTVVYSRLSQFLGFDSTLTGPGGEATIPRPQSSTQCCST